MRPLTLRMSGLRSYRSEVTIDFGDPGLIAIVGDTGAGKSSILEALFFVLYGGCTWDQRAVVPLISDGATVMQVELVFLAEGRRWRVFRSASLSGSQSRHELECLDDPAIRFDNDGPVTNEIKRLVGLDRDAFLRTVILPQGRFQALLQATRVDRTAILKGIFRLEQLAAARDHADTAARRIRPGIQGLRDKRMELLPDPHAMLAEARERHKQADERRAVLVDLSAAISRAGVERDRAIQEASDLQARAQAVTDTAIPSASGDLARLAAARAELDDQRRGLDAERDRHRQDATSLTDVLAQAEAAGEGVQALASASATVKSLASQLPRLIDDEASSAQEAADLDALSENARTKQSYAAALAAKAAEAQAEQKQLEEADSEASERFAQATALMRTVRERAEVCSRWQDAARQAGELETAALAAIPKADELVKARARDCEAARRALEDIQRTHAAAHAAEECRPGDPCPICQRPLPANFHVPTPPGEENARQALNAADQEAADAARELHGRQADLATATRDRERADQEVQQAKAGFDDAVAELRLVHAAIDLDAADETALAPLAAASRAAAAKREEQAAEASKLAGTAAAARAEADTLGQQLNQRSGQLRVRQDSLVTRRGAFDEAAGSLPARYRPGAPITADELAAAARRLDDRRAELTKVGEQLADAQRSIDQVTGDLEALSQRVRTEVDEPTQALKIKLAVAEQRLHDLVTILEKPAGWAKPGDQGEPVGQAEWARALTDATDAALAQAQAAIARLNERRDQALSVISAALSAAGAADEEKLQEALTETVATLRRAEDDIRVATEQIPLVADLTGRISEGEGLLAALDELTRLLSDGKFIAYVVNRKQQTLLAVATEVLGTMTGGRYGFSEAFQIVDRLTGLPRGVKTLSGGETFLASLALALGLVELAGKGGGRLDALFLDEGFGSLDANALSEALDALGRQAETGRLVAVISHLRSVAESMDRVLAVSSGPSGSQVRWLGGEERDQIITEDVEASLLS